MDLTRIRPDLSSTDYDIHYSQFRRLNVTGTCQFPPNKSPAAHSPFKPSPKTPSHAPPHRSPPPRPTHVPAPYPPKRSTAGCARQGQPPTSAVAAPPCSNFVAAHSAAEPPPSPPAPVPAEPPGQQYDPADY